MSPEQARGETATERQRRVLARRGPLRARHGHAPVRVGVDARHAARHHVERGAESRCEWVPDMPPMLERLLLRMLEKPEAARPTAAEVEAELTKLAAGLLEPVDALSWAIARAPQRRDHNLPSQRTALVGRGAELASVKDMLLDSGSPAADADRTRRHRQDAPGHSGGRRSRPSLRRRRVVRQPRADRRSATGGVGRRPVARRSRERRSPAREGDRRAPAQPRPDAPADGQFRAGVRCRGPGARTCWTPVPR